MMALALPPADTGNATVIHCPKSGVSLWDLGDFQESMEEARVRALPILQALAAERKAAAAGAAAPAAAAAQPASAVKSPAAR